MNLQARIDRYGERGFQELEAEILVLIEESALSVVARSDTFVSKRPSKRRIPGKPESTRTRTGWF